MTTPRWVMRNSRGEPDGMWTFTALSFALVFVSTALSVVLALAGLALVPTEALEQAGWLFGLCVGGYWGRKHSDRRSRDVDAIDDAEVE